MFANKFYTYLMTLYRVGVVAVVITMDILMGFDYEKEKLIVYVTIGLYAILFSAFRINKWIAYAELLAIAGLLEFVDSTSLYLLFLIPFTNFASSNAKKLDIVLFWLLSSGYIFYKAENMYVAGALAFGLIAILYIFHQRFNLIERLTNELFQAKDDIKEYRNEITNQQLGFEITSKMFYQMRELSEAKTEEEVVQKIVSGSLSFFNAVYSVVYIKERGEEEENYVLAFEEGEKRRYEVPDVLFDTEEDKEPIFEGNVMRMLITVNGEEWGIVAIYGKRMAIGNEGQMVNSPFSDTDFETMITYIYSASKRVTELRISQQNLFLANNDFLTKVPNRRYFWEQLDRMVDLAQRGDEFAVLMMDIDNFKSFNDTYGHDMGDSVLKIVAETIEETIRKADIVGRLGGEEFAVILYKPKGEAMLVADRIRKMVAAIPAVRQITLSIGLAYYGKHGDSVEELMRNVDAAMYVAKQTGKNKVVEYKYGMNMDES